LTKTCVIPEPLLAALRDAQHLCILTGAGVSAESGVPTFREAQDGLWADYDPLQLATPEGFLDNPELVWRWYRWRRELVAKAQPNAAHIAIAELASIVPQLTLVTQNVDNLHQRAGSHQAIEFHGNLFIDRCFDCALEGSADPQQDVPRCESCGGKLRPGVVWFGEAIPEDAMNQSFAAASDCDVFMAIGTSSLVQPAAGLADVAAASGALTVEINPDPVRRGFDVVLDFEAGTAIPHIVDMLGR
jgi:NAD-dependent deacetylase